MESIVTNGIIAQLWDNAEIQSKRIDELEKRIRELESRPPSSPVLNPLHPPAWTPADGSGTPFIAPAHFQPAFPDPYRVTC